MKVWKPLLFGLLIWSMGAGFATAATIKIVAFGDSLMASYQIEPSLGFPAQLAKALEAKGLDIEMTDAAVSGDTTSGGLGRLDWSVPDGTQFVVGWFQRSSSGSGLVGDLQEIHVTGVGAVVGTPLTISPDVSAYSAPLMATNGSGRTLLAYSRFDSAAPFMANRVRARFVGP